MSIAQSARRVRAAVKRSLDGDDEALHSKVYGDGWKSPKDGKQMVDPNSKWITTTPQIVCASMPSYCLCVPMNRMYTILYG
jgi:hypothetical protein